MVNQRPVVLACLLVLFSSWLCVGCHSTACQVRDVRVYSENSAGLNTWVDYQYYRTRTGREVMHGLYREGLTRDGVEVTISEGAYVEGKQAGIWTQPNPVYSEIIFFVDDVPQWVEWRDSQGKCFAAIALCNRKPFRGTMLGAPATRAAPPDMLLRYFWNGTEVSKNEYVAACEREGVASTVPGGRVLVGQYVLQDDGRGSVRIIEAGHSYRVGVPLVSDVTKVQVTGPLVVAEATTGGASRGAPGDSKQEWVILDSRTGSLVTYVSLDECTARLKDLGYTVTGDAWICFPPRSH